MTGYIKACLRASLLILGCCAIPALGSCVVDDDAEQVEAEQLPIGSDCGGTAYENLFGLNVWAADPTYLPDVETLGARWVRIEMRLSGGRDINYYKGVIDKVHDKGVKVLLLVDYELVPGAPGWQGTTSAWQSYRQAFRAKLIQVADALGSRVDAWEIWNEPDHELSGGYDPGVPATQFGYLLKEAAEVIRPRSLGLLIVGGMAKRNYGYFYTARSSAGASMSQYDGMGVHTYGPASWSMTTVRNEINLVVNGWYAASGLPIWITEAGGVAYAGAEAFADQYLRTLYEHTWTYHKGKVESIFYFSWSDAVGFASERFGLIRHDGSRKPAFSSYALLSPDSSAASCSGPGAPTSPPQAEICVGPTQGGCYSATMTSKLNLVDPSFGSCQVAAGSQVQVSYAACGSSSCGWYTCKSGLWQCSSASDLPGPAATMAGCSNAPPGTTSKPLWRASSSDRNAELSACAAAANSGTVSFASGAGWTSGHAACQAAGAGPCKGVVDWQCKSLSCDASVETSRMVLCQ